jgi:DNA topoisomerase-2
MLIIIIFAVAKSDIVDNLLSWAKFKESKELKKTDGTKTAKVNVPKLEDANEAGGRHSEKCTLILTEGDSAKALAVSSMTNKVFGSNINSIFFNSNECMQIAGVAGLTQTERSFYGVFPLRGKLLNVREATPKQLKENKEIECIKKILGLQHHKQYSNVKSLRYGHLMIMTDQASASFRFFAIESAHNS